MKTELTMIKTLTVLLSLGLGLSGCFASSGEKKMMDDSMTAPMETMEKDSMGSQSDTMK